MNDRDLQHLAAIVRDSDDAIMGKTLEGIITSWNGGAERIYGYTAEEAIGRTVAMLVPPDREDEQPEILRKLSIGEGINHYDTLRVTKGGRIVNISLTLSPIRDASGAICGISSIGRDVTKEKEAEAALVESARAYKLLMEQASDAILVSYPDQPLIEVNQRATDMLGYTREELLQLRGKGNALPEGLSTLPLLPDEILEGSIVYAERTVRRKDGTALVTELSTRRLDDGRILTIARDITDRKRAEEALRESETRLRSAIDLAQLSSYKWNAQTDALSLDVGLREIWGLTPDTSVDIGIFLAGINPDDREAVQAEITRCSDPAGDGLFVAEFRVIGRQDKQERWVSARGKMFFEGGVAVHHVGIAQDITERKQAEVALVRSAAELRALFAAMKDVVMVLDAQGRYLQIAPTNPDLLYKPTSELLGRTIHEVLPTAEADNILRLIQLAMEKQQPVDVEYSLPIGDSDVWFDGSVSPMGEGKVIWIARDVTERKAAEQSLRDSEERFRLMFASNPLPMWVYDLESLQFLEVNEAAVGRYGYSRAEFLAMRISDIRPSEELPRLIENLAQARPVMESSGEWRHQKKDGQIIDVQITSHSFQFSKRIAALIVAEDITERKRAEEAMQRHTLTFETIHDAIFFTDVEGKIIDCNPAAESMSGYSKAELLGKSTTLLHKPAGSARLRAKVEEDLQRCGRWSGERNFVRKDGTEGVVEAAIVLMYDQQDQPFAAISTNRDITGRKRDEEALLSSEQKFRSIFENTLDAMFILDNRGRYVEVNRAAAQLTGLSREELIGHSYVEFQDHADTAKLERLSRKLLRQGEAFGELPFVGRNGETRQVEYYSKANFIPGYHLLVVHDVTEHKRAEDARLAQEAAEQANRAKSEFLSRMSHELRTPLNAILGFGQLLQMESTTPDQQESVDYIIKAGQHLLSLIDEVLDIARIEEGKLTISMEPVSVRDVLQESLDLVHPLAVRRNIEVKADLGWTESCFVMADHQRLQQVLLNLLANAIKYNREGGAVNVSCSNLSYEVDGQDPQSAQSAQSAQSLARVRIEVSDTGPGLSPDKVARLFTPFERLGAEHSDVEGTGLGLALSRQLVEAMGGAIGVESEQGIGSTFWVELSPADEQMPGFDLLITGPLFEIQVGEQAHTVLYIEDNLSNLRLIERILKKRPELKLITAIQGQMGLDMAYEHRPDLILLDLHLPDMAGNEVLRRLREDPRTALIPVVVLSADANPRRVDKLLEAGAQAYLTKPLDVNQLLTVLGETLAHNTV